MSGIWGTHQSYNDFYALRDAPLVLRVLLPVTVGGRDEHVRWEDVARDFHRNGSVNGRTSWTALTALPGDGSWWPRYDYIPAQGDITPTHRDALVDALASVAGAGDWRQEPSALRDVAPTALVDVGRTIPPPPTRVTEWKMSRGPAPLRELAAAWPRHGLPLRLWSEGARVGMAGPEYADSLIISGPVNFDLAIIAAGFEVFPVQRNDKCRIEGY